MIEIRPVTGIGEVESGADLGQILANGLSDIGLKGGDILVITQKVVSKAEGRMVALKDVSPSERANEIAGAIGKDPRLVELILNESSEVVRAEKGLLITRHNLGHVMANAGIDCSNLGAPSQNQVMLLPIDPDASAKQIADTIESQCGQRPSVIISDSFGRPWRQGVINVAIGCSDVPSVHDMRGEKDRDGREMQTTVIAYGDLLASAAGLAMGEAAEGIPAALISGLALPGAPLPASALVRPVEEDLFR